MKIGIVNLGRDEFDYGVALVCSKIKNADFFSATPKTAKFFDVLLIGLFWWEHLYLMADWLRKAGIDKKHDKRPRIIVGGFNSFNPAPILAYADCVVVGDGEGAIGAALSDVDHPSVYRQDGQSVQYATAEKIQPIAHVNGDIARIEIARGCKGRCKFCSVTWLKRYREADQEDVLGLIRQTKQKRISLFAPCPEFAKGNKAYDDAISRAGKMRLDADMRLDQARKSDCQRIAPRIGIEGLSERLRTSVGKPYSDDFIVEQMDRMFMQGTTSATWYLILDLPGETDDDWRAMDALLRRISMIKKDATLFLFPNVFAPKPHTPLEMAGINWDRDYYTMWQERWKKPFGGQVRIMAKTRIHAPEHRILEMISLRAGSEFYDIERELSGSSAIKVGAGNDNSARRVRVKNKIALHQILSKYGHPDCCCSENPPAPWKVVNGQTA